MKRNARLTLTALLLAQLAEPHAKRNVPDFPKFGKRRGENFQPLELTS